MRKLLVPLVGVTCASLVLLEILVRILMPLEPSTLVPDPILNHRWRPNSISVHREWKPVGLPEYTHYYNSEGWISRSEIAKRKAPGTERIFYIGDSFTEGTCPMEESVPSRVSAALNGAESPPRYEVINTGTLSYAPSIYYLLTTTKLLDYEPDLLVVNVDMTDVFDDSIYQMSAKYDAAGELIAVPPFPELAKNLTRTAAGTRPVGLVERFLKAAGEYSHFFKVTSSRFTGYLDRRSIPKGTATGALHLWCNEEWGEGVKSQIAWSMGMLGKLIDRAKERGVRVAVAGIPHLEQLEGKWSSRPFEEISRVAKAHGAMFIETRNAFEEKVVSKKLRLEDLYIPGDMHFNSRGYELLAEIHIEALRASLGW